MSGIYIHIPYCKTKCNYCDFYSITNKSTEQKFVQALLKEIELKKPFFKQDKTVETIYFGGGTPSFILPENIEKILVALHHNFAIDLEPEITLEANPDDLTLEKLQNYKSMGFNRISMGVQSLLPEQLRFMQRRHSVEQARQAVKDVFAAGFSNMSIDLIYGLPHMQLSDWEKSLKEALSWETNHLSAYHLTVEENTPLYRLVKSNQVKTIDDELSYRQFEMLMDISSEYGFEQYEISNFARNKAYSRHNTSYWQDIEYLGLGPSAHSYNGLQRCANVANIRRYINNIKTNSPFYECEKLSELDKFNDQIITQLRTMKGIDKTILNNAPIQQKNLNKLVNKYINTGFLEENSSHVKLSRKGIHLADSIMADLILVE